MEKKSWDGYCQTGKAQGKHRLRLLARALVDADSREACDHYRTILEELVERENERARKVMSPRNEDQVPERLANPLTYTWCD